MNNDFKTMWNQAVEKAKVVKKVEVGGDNRFPYMSLNDGILTIDHITWHMGSLIVPMGASVGVTRFIVPALIGSLTGVTQLAIVVFILINLAQTKFGKPIETTSVEELKSLRGADAGLVEYLKNDLYSLLVNYIFERSLGDFIRNRVKFLMSTKQINDLAEETIRKGLELGVLE